MCIIINSKIYRLFFLFLNTNKRHKQDQDPQVATKHTINNVARLSMIYKTIIKNVLAIKSQNFTASLQYVGRTSRYLITIQHISSLHACEVNQLICVTAFIKISLKYYITRNKVKDVQSLILGFKSRSHSNQITTFTKFYYIYII